ncbi:4-hydroxythreonine-4-phosphate dehydrogenase PdxA [Reichenbachiella versicolor]|uniref:4-hydroxythreonine-4-phosphate dehydrogenase PdxA n=1 Tax=Reichenbachiella versicolor TaxID=1821036 RepID=UPI000D6DD005|nr:4-hydroxythreonine-4-phosphate dehydrogenase PdxA [Reichenbachiella versicolor]
MEKGNRQSNQKKEKKPIIGISIGDINGIGPEVIIRSLDNNKITKQMTPVIYGSAKVMSFYRKNLNATHFNFTPINDLSKVYHRKVNVLNCWEEPVELTPGKSTDVGGKYAFKALELATNDLIAGNIDALVTAPINKLNIQNDDFKFPGHTEYLTQKAEAKDGLMFMVAEDLRVGVLTGHIPLKDVPSKIKKEFIEDKLKLMISCLKEDFGVLKPKVAVLGLNPHAGEDGLLGKEEVEIIKPAVESIKSKGSLVMGPFPADGFFGSGQYKKFDGILAMYHDQGLVPFKSLVFSAGVNYTAGLPIVRTSPDHGTAYDLVGKNIAEPGSMLTALFTALDIANQRKEELV